MEYRSDMGSHHVPDSNPFSALSVFDHFVGLALNGLKKKVNGL